MAAHDSTGPLVPRWMLVTVVAALLGYLVYLLRGLLTPVLLALLIAYVLDPVVDRLVRWRIPRGLAIFALLGTFLGVVLVVLLSVVPSAVREATEFYQRLPALVDQTWKRLEPWLTTQGVVLPHTLQDLQEQLGGNAGTLSAKVASALGNVIQWIAGSTASIVNAAVDALIVPVLAFYFLYDWDRITSTVTDLVPIRARPLFLAIASDIDGVVAHFIRGQLVVMGMLAVAYSVAYSALGVPLAIPIGVLAGLVSFIPHVGGAVALLTALVACVLTGPTWLQLLLVVVVHFSIQTLEGFVITPRIMSGQVGLPAAWVILALIGFGELFGLFGVVIAVPAAAAIKTLLARLIDAYKASALYGAPPAELANPPPSIPPVSLPALGSRRASAAPPTSGEVPPPEAPEPPPELEPASEPPAR